MNLIWHPGLLIPARMERKTTEASLEETIPEKKKTLSIGRGEVVWGM